MTTAPAPTIRPATAADIPILAELNRQLLQDEGHRLDPTLEWLEARHRGWLETGAWRQDILEMDGETVGYVAWKPVGEPIFPDQPEIYVRQFCIDRSRRGGGLGRAGFALFLRERAGTGTRVTLDVMETNPVGQAFWTAMGCRPYYTQMEIVAGD